MGLKSNNNFWAEKPLSDLPVWASPLYFISGPANVRGGYVSFKKVKTCTKCNAEKTLDESNFYVLRPSASHPNGGWQAHCRECWKQINSNNKRRRAMMYSGR